MFSYASPFLFPWKSKLILGSSLICSSFSPFSFFFKLGCQAVLCSGCILLFFLWRGNIWACWMGCESSKCLDSPYCVCRLLVCLAISSYLDAACAASHDPNLPLFFCFPSFSPSSLCCVGVEILVFFSRFGMHWQLCRVMFFSGFGLPCLTCSPFAILLPFFAWVLWSVAVALVYAERWLRNILTLISFSFSDWSWIVRGWLLIGFCGCFVFGGWTSCRAGARYICPCHLLLSEFTRLLLLTRCFWWSSLAWLGLLVAKKCFDFACCREKEFFFL